MNPDAAYDSISVDYAELVGHDPAKLYVQYPWAIAQLPVEINGLRILDIGCGEGSLARILAGKGGTLYGYDNSIAQIRQARKAEERRPLGIAYLHADPSNVAEKTSPILFDFALSTSVLHYARDQDHLAAFFSSTWQLLSAGDTFAALVFNPDFRRFDQRIYNRQYSREPNGRLRVDFFDSNQKRCSAFYSDFSRFDYEHAASANGWTAFTWTAVEISRKGREDLGNFWLGFEEDCPYAAFRVTKRVN